MTTPVFTRTAPGLSNQAAFLGVDLVIFAESGYRTLSLEEAEQGLENGETFDSVFWRAVLDTFCPPNKAFHIKTIGSKTTVRVIAQMVADGVVTRVATSMDRDLDLYRGTIVVHTNVLYTRGYSWENDIWTPTITKAIVNSLVPDRRHRRTADVEIDSFFTALERCFRITVRVDRRLATLGYDPVPRDAIEEVVRPNPPGPPVLLRNDLALVLKEIRMQTGVKLHEDGGNILCDLHGHTLAKAALSFLRNLVQVLANHKVSNALLTSMAVTEFVRNPNAPMLDHYAQPVKDIVW
jgi:hypothetical protein